MKTAEDYEFIHRLDMMMAREKVSLGELSKFLGIHVNNLAVLRRGKARSIRFSTLLGICIALNCKPTDLFEISLKKKEMAKPGASPALPSPQQ